MRVSHTDSKYLALLGDDWKTPSVIAYKLGLRPQSASGIAHHLSGMRARGLLEWKAEHGVGWYRISQAGADALAAGVKVYEVK